LPRSPLALAPDGGMGIMVYGALGRTGVYPMQAMLKTLSAYAPAPALTATTQLAAARDLLKQLPATNWLRRNPAIGDHLAGGDAGLADLLLHPQDRAYTVPELAELVRGAGLEIAAFIEPWRYDPASYLTDPSLLHRLERLDPIARDLRRAARRQSARHIVYLVRKGPRGSAVARPDDDSMVPVLARRRRRPRRALKGAAISRSRSTGSRCGCRPAAQRRDPRRGRRQAQHRGRSRRWKHRGMRSRAGTPSNRPSTASTRPSTS
jgi:hypothetical protein